MIEKAGIAAKYHMLSEHMSTKTIGFLNNAVFWHVKPCSSCRNGRFGEKNRLHHQGNKNRRVLLCSVLWLLVTVNVVPRQPSLFTLLTVAICSSEMSFLTRATRRNIQEDGILLRHRRKQLKYYNNFPFQ
jgi:hypothetical protein